MVKTTQKSDLPWSAIFWVIVYCLISNDVQLTVDPPMDPFMKRHKLAHDGGFLKF